jgi:hypothetical protein
MLVIRKSYQQRSLRRINCAIFLTCYLDLLYSWTFALRRRGCCGHFIYDATIRIIRFQ